MKLLILCSLMLVQQDPVPRRGRLYEIASSKTLSNVNHNDARATLKVWAEMIAQQKGFSLDSRIDIIDSIAEIGERLQNHSVDMLMLSVTEYLELETQHPVVPVFTSARGAHGSAPYPYVLAVKSAQTLASLKGKNILAYSRSGENTGLAWLDVLLGKEQLGRAATYFGSIKTTDKPQACILPLFFGSIDACIVDEVNLNLAKEMNPQLAQLKVLAHSRPMIESVIATPAGSHPYFKELMDTLLTLDKDPRGRQVLMVFKTDRLVPIEPGDIESAREMWRDYFHLPGAVPNRLPWAQALEAKVIAR